MAAPPRSRLPQGQGYTLDGGYADFAVADARYCFRLPDAYSDVEVAPLMVREVSWLSDAV